MFAELLDVLAMQSRNTQARLAAIEAALAAQAQANAEQFRVTQARFDAVQVTLAVHSAALEKILAAVYLPPAVRGVLAMQWEGIARVEGEHIEMKVPQNKQGTLSVTLKNASGGPGRVDGIPEWKAEPAGVVELTPSADGLTCVAKTLPVDSVDEVKSAVITFTADGDLGDGVTNIVATGTITVFDESGSAVTAEIAFGGFTDVGAPIEPKPPVEA